MSSHASFRKIVLPVLAALLIGLLGAAALLYQGWQEYSRSARYQLADVWIQGQQAWLGHALQRLETLGEGLGQLPELQQDPGQAVLDQLARRHQLQALRLFPVSLLQTDQQLPAPVNFGVLDLLRRALNDAPSAPEVYQVDGQWLLYSATVLKVAGQPHAVLLLAAALDDLLAAMPALPDNLGQITLIQQYPPGEPQMLLQRGFGHGERWQWPTAHPGWQLHFVAGPALQPPLPALRLPGLALLVLVAAVLMGAIVALYLQRRAEADARSVVLPMAAPAPYPPPPAPAAQAASHAPPVRQKPATGDDVFDLSDGN